MTREELAARIMCAHVKDGAVCFDFCFELADRFLAYAAKEREKEKHREPKAQECEHVWGTKFGDMHIYECRKCGAPKVREESKAKEVWVCFNSSGIPMYAWDQQDRDKTRRLFREVLDV